MRTLKIPDLVKLLCCWGAGIICCFGESTQRQEGSGETQPWDLARQVLSLEFVEARAKAGPAELEHYLQMLEREEKFYHIGPLAEVLFGMVRCHNVEPSVLDRMQRILESKLRDPKLNEVERERVEETAAFTRLRQSERKGKVVHPLLVPLLSGNGSAVEQEIRILTMTYSYRYYRRHEQPKPEWFARFDATGGEGVETLLTWLDVRPRSFPDIMVKMLGFSLDRLPLNPELKRRAIAKVVDVCLEPNFNDAAFKPGIEVLGRHASEWAVEQLLPLLTIHSYSGPRPLQW